MSDPSPTTTPPTGGGPSPQQIGRAFIKQYYKILLTSPSQLNRFYQPDSTVSRGMEPSAPAPPEPFSHAASGAMNGGAEDSSTAVTPGERVRKAFFDWAGSDSTLSIDFERGAIDAQESIGGGILLVVTGHMFLPGKVEVPSPFVHTFFLNNAAGAGRKKQFLVKNDILRFLEPVVSEVVEDEIVAAVVVEEEVVVVPEMEVPAPAAAVVEEPVAVVEEPPAPVVVVDDVVPVEPVVESAPIVPVVYEPSADEEKAEEDEDDTVEEPVVPTVEHTIVDVEPAAEEVEIEAETSSTADSDATPTATTSPTNSDNGKKAKRNRKKRGGKSRSRSNSPQKEDAKEDATPEKPKAPGSWASLVASGGSGPRNTSSEGGKSSSKGSGRRGSPKAASGGASGGSSSDNKSAGSQEVKAPPQSQAAKEPSATPAVTPAPSTNASAAPSSSTAATSSSTSAVTSTAPTQSTSLRTTHRNPEATIFIRNIPDKTQEPEIRALFESYGVTTGNKLVGITLNPNRGFCFVDFDGPDAVTAIVKESSTSLIKDTRTGRKIESSFMVHGRVLELERKVQTGNKGGGHGGGRRFNRSHSPKDAGGGRYRGSRGGGMRRSPPRDARDGGGGGNRNR